MEKLKEFCRESKFGICIYIGLLLVFILLMTGLYYDPKPHRPELSTDQKVDMIADHLEIEFKYIEPQAGYWKIKQNLRFWGELSIPNPTSSNIITGNVTDLPNYDSLIHEGDTITWNDSPSNLRDYNVSFDVTDDLVDKIRGLRGVSSVYNTHRYKIQVFKGDSFDWDEVHSHIIYILQGGK